MAPKNKFKMTTQNGVPKWRLNKNSKWRPKMAFNERYKIDQSITTISNYESTKNHLLGLK